MDFSVQKLISDSLEVVIPVDSTANVSNPITVVDLRQMSGTYLAVTQINRYWYIPVDQYMILNKPLSEILSMKLKNIFQDQNPILSIDHLNIWQDSGPLLNKGWKINSQTTLHIDSNEMPRIFYWDIRLPRKFSSKELDQNFAKLLELWIQAIQDKLENFDSPLPQSSTGQPYKRQLDTWMDFVMFPQGKALNARMLLEYPENQLSRWTRGNPGILYSRFIRYESVSIGGWEQIWYSRFKDNLITRIGFTGRVGLNSFNPDYFEHVDWTNIFLVQLSAQAHIDYYWGDRQQRFVGLGLFQSGNILPDNVSRFNTGVSATIGFTF